MELTLIDKSNYLKGLLIVAKKDNQLTDSEKNIIKNISSRLGFAKDFYEETIRGLMANKYINETPIKFSNKMIAESFVTDGIRLAFSDGTISEKEISWIKETASANEIKDDWIEDKVNKIKDHSGYSISSEFSLFSII